MEQQKFFNMEEFTIPFKLKILLITVCFVPIVFLFIYVNYDGIMNPKSSKEVFLELIFKEECDGIIDSIYRQKMNHNILTLKTEFCVHTVPRLWETKFEVGDSISKRKGESILKHYREGKLIEILDYNDIAKNMK